MLQSPRRRRLQYTRSSIGIWTKIYTLVYWSNWSGYDRHPLHSQPRDTDKPKNNINNRANIMFFIEVLCDMALRENLPEFVVRIQREIFRIVDAVAPADGSGAANVKVARRVGYGWSIFMHCVSN